ncbi:MAG: transglycosylase SLT domain-containing protein [Streptosporangiaceae bacterium]|jgi:hypothetical protein
MITSVAAVVAITAGALVGLRLNERGADPVAVYVAGISTSHSAGLLEQARQHMIQMDAAALTFSVVSPAKLATQPAPAASSPSTSTDVAAAAGPSVPSGPPPDPGTAQAIAYQMLPSFGFNAATQYGCLNNIWTRESGWNYEAENASGAYGIPQALPGSKMASAGPDWQTDPTTQIKWGLGYIQGRYGTPCNAWAFWQANGWY